MKSFPYNILEKRNDIKFSHDTFLDFSSSLESQEDLLQEDMLQIEFPNEFIIDVGWYDSKKAFIIYVIQCYNWENPIKKVFAKSLVELKSHIDNLIFEFGEKERK